MFRFLLQRLLNGVFVLLGVLVGVFVLFQLLPGDPARLLMGQRADVASIEVVRRELGLDKPPLIQFFLYLNDVSPVSIHPDSAEHLANYRYVRLFKVDEKVVVLKVPYLRRSYHSRRPVWDIIIEALPNTVVLAVAAMGIAVTLGILLGVLSALSFRSAFDHFIVSASVLGISTPSFFAGIVIAWFFGYLLAPWTGLNMTGSLFELGPTGEKELVLKNLVLPAITLGIRPLAVIVQLTRSSVLDVLREDYIRTAKAKGLGLPRIIFKHVLRNALNPVVTVASGWLAELLAGAFFVEYVFSWRGLGMVAVESLQRYDFPLVMGIALFAASIFVVINILVDIVYALLDPRVSHR